MAGLMKIPGVGDVWRVLKEMDLEAIRREADTRFEVLIAADERTDAEATARLLTGAPDGSRHPWLRLSGIDPSSADGEPDPALVMLVSRSPELSALLADVRDLWRHRAPVLVVALGAGSATDGVVRPGESWRVALDGEAPDVAAVAHAMVPLLPAPLRLALGRQLPPLRDAVAEELVDSTSRANAVYSLTTGLAEVVPVVNVPLNVADIVVLTKNQLLMAYKIALVAGRSGAPTELMAEIMGVVGSAFLLRQGARQLIGLLPIAGVVPKVAVSYAGTWAVGRAVTAWALRGAPVSGRTVHGYYKQAWPQGRQVAREMARRKPSLPPA